MNSYDCVKFSLRHFIFMRFLRSRHGKQCIYDWINLNFSLRSFMILRPCFEVIEVKWILAPILRTYSFFQTLKWYDTHFFLKYHLFLHASTKVYHVLQSVMCKFVVQNIGQLIMFQKVWNIDKTLRIFLSLALGESGHAVSFIPLRLSVAWPLEWYRC